MSKIRNGRGATCAAVVLPIALAACAGGASTHTYIFNRDLRGHVQYAAAYPPTPVAIFNSPVDANAVLAAMQGRNPGPPMTFTMDPVAASSYRIVVSFGEPPVGPNNVCQVTSLMAPPASAGRTDVSAAFCVAGMLISQADAGSERLTSAQDPRLPRLMSDLLEALMPYNNPLYNNDASPGM